MKSRLGSWMALFWLVASSGCDRPQPMPEPLRFQPRMAEFEALRAGEPKPAPEDAASRDLLVTAFSASSPDLRLRAMAKRSLLEAEDCDLVLEAGLLHDDPLVRSNAAFELGNRKRTQAVPLLLRRLKDETDPEARLYLADALGRLGNLAALPVIRDGILGAKAEAALGLARAQLARYGAEMAAAASAASVQSGLDRLHGYWRTLGTPPGGSAPAFDQVTSARLARCLVDLEAEQLRSVDEARFVLSRMGAGVIPLLVKAVAASERYLRQHAVEILGRMGPQGWPAAQAVRALLRDPDTRVEAARTLGAIGAAVAVPDLLSLLDDPDPEMRCAAAEALGPIGAVQAIPSLGALLDREQAGLDLRVRVAFSLAILEPHGPGEPFLRERLRADDYHGPTVRELLDRAIATW